MSSYYDPLRIVQIIDSSEVTVISSGDDTVPVGEDTITGDDVVIVEDDKVTVIADRGLMRYSMQYLYPFTYKTMTQIPDITGLKNISYMYAGCANLRTTTPIDTHEVEDMCGLFKGCGKLPSTLFYTIDMFSLPHISNRYYGAMVKDSSIRNITITGIDERNVADVAADLGITVKYEQAPTTKTRKWDRRFKPTNICTMNGLFNRPVEYEVKKKIIDPLTNRIKYETEIKTIPYYQTMTDIEEDFTWNIEELKSIENMFAWSYALETIPDINGGSANQLEDMTRAFAGCEMLTTLPLIDIHAVKKMVETFSGCTSLKVLPEWVWSHTQLENMTQCFDGCSSLLYPPELDTSSCYNFRYCYRGCQSLSEQYPYYLNFRGVIEDANSPGINNALHGMFEDSSVYTIYVDGVASKYRNQITSQLLKGDDTMTIKFVD